MTGGRSYDGVLKAVNHTGRYRNERHILVQFIHMLVFQKLGRPTFHKVTKRVEYLKTEKIFS